MRKKFFCTGFILFFLLNVAAAQMPVGCKEFAEYRNAFLFSVFLEGNQSKIEQLHSMFFPNPAVINYTAEGKPMYGAGGGFFINYRRNFFALQAEASYSQQGGIFKFSNGQSDFKYDVKFDYRYLNFNLLLKGYLGIDRSDFMNRTNLGLGINAGHNVSPENVIFKYRTTNVPVSFGSELQQSQQLKTVLKARTNFMGMLTLGHEFPYTTDYYAGKSGVPLMIEIRYLFGLSDVIETSPNDYNFVETRNINSVIQLRLVYYFTDFFGN